MARIVRVRRVWPDRSFGQQYAGRERPTVSVGVTARDCHDKEANRQFAIFILRFLHGADVKIRNWEDGSLFINGELCFIANSDWQALK